MFIGKAQEKTPLFRTEKRRNPQTGSTYPWMVRSSAMVNHFYCYCRDRVFGPFLLKLCSYFPSNRMLKKAEIQLPTRAAHCRECVFARVYRAATVRESVPDDFFSSPLMGSGA